uniref:Uncharacterized protein n=1 Tax=Pseudo-nitzschia australis TaxID=44445 RepID=A0A6U9ZS53_9STRA
MRRHWGLVIAVGHTTTGTHTAGISNPDVPKPNRELVRFEGIPHQARHGLRHSKPGNGGDPKPRVLATPGAVAPPAQVRGSKDVPVVNANGPVAGDGQQDARGVPRHAIDGSVSTTDASAAATCIVPHRRMFQGNPGGDVPFLGPTNGRGWSYGRSLILYHPRLARRREVAIVWVLQQATTVGDPPSECVDNISWFRTAGTIRGDKVHRQSTDQGNADAPSMAIVFGGTHGWYI